MKIMQPWIPVEADVNENNIITKGWGRKYQAGKTSFLE